MKKAKIVVIGSSNTDMVIKSHHLPAPGETILGGQFYMTAGGKGANQAVASARLGADVTFVAKVGNDIFGKKALENFKNDNIDISYIQADDNVPSGIALILVDTNGENLISVAPGANFLLSPKDVEQAEPRIKEADLVLVQLEVPLDTVEKAAILAEKHNVPLLLDPAPAPISGLHETILKRTKYIKPNETELSAITNVKVNNLTDIEYATGKLLSMGPKTVIVTLGAEGAFVSDGMNKNYFKTKTVTSIDATAAGDAFSGAFAVAVGEGLPLDRSIEMALATATLSVTKAGAQPSMPTRKELNDFLTSK